MLCPALRQASPGGLFVSMATFRAVGPQHVARYAAAVDCPLFLHVLRLRVPRQPPAEHEPPQKKAPSKLAIGGERERESVRESE